jgi:hypothetical protein
MTFTNGKFGDVFSADLVIDYLCIHSQNIKKVHNTYFYSSIEDKELVPVF